MYKSRRRRIKLVLHMRNSFYLVDYIYYICRCSGGWVFLVVVVVVGMVVVLCLHWCLVKLSTQHRSLHDITFALVAAAAAPPPPRLHPAGLSNLEAPLMACDKPRRDSDTRSASSMRDSVHIVSVYQYVS